MRVHFCLKFSNVDSEMQLIEAPVSIRPEKEYWSISKKMQPSEINFLICLALPGSPEEYMLIVASGSLLLGFDEFITLFNFGEEFEDGYCS